MDKMIARPATATAKASNNSEAKKKKAPSILTYKDYMTREEKYSTLQKQILTPKTTSQINLMRTTASSRPQTAVAIDSYQFKQRVEQKFQNFVQKRDLIADDDSLLQNSQQSRDKTEKQHILEQQKHERRLAAQEKKRIELEKTQKVKDGLDALNRKVRQNIKNQSKREKRSKSKEQSRERSLLKRNAELVKKHAPDKSAVKLGAAAQLQDLKSWIEEQMHSDGIDDQNLDSSSREDSTKKNKENTSENTALSLKEVGVSTDLQKIKMLKHQLPGNHLLSEKEEAKLGARQNRYGLFETGQNEFEKVVEIQREKLAPKKVEVQQPISQADQKLSKDHVRDLIMQLAQRSGIALQSQTKSSVVSESKNAVFKPNDDLSEDSCDKVPVRQTDKAIISRSILNVKAQELNKTASTLPGITDTRKKQEALDKEIKEKETKAVQVIQKFLRGHWGRREAARKLYRRKNAIEDEYSRFQREYKSDQGYNLKQYVKDKQRMRIKNGFDSIEDIAEVIGESSSTTTAHIVQSSVQMQNFFKFGQQQTDYDPLSLISIYAKRHSKAPTQKKEPSQTIQKQSKKVAKDFKITHSNSIIEEDIYSENFDNDIAEDIQKASSSASSIMKQKKKGKALAESDSIADEAPSAAISKSDSIADEVGNVATKDNSDIESSIREDSIIRDEFDSDNYKVSNAKKQLEARTRVTYSLNTDQLTNLPNQRQKLLLQVEEEKRSDKIKSQNLVGALLGQMRDFESAALSQTMLDRMEKIVTSSLAQKDQIIMAQRLAELERENRHKEEINKIREEQIRLMTQLMLLGNAGASQTQRDDIINSIRSIAEQPVVIREQPVFQHHQASMPVPLTHQQLYQQNKRTKITYLDEYDQSKHSNKFSSGKFSDIKENKSAKKSQDLRDDLSDDIVDEVGSVKSDSIAEEIEESQEKSSSNTFEEYKTRQFKLVMGNKTLLSTYVSDVEKAINRQKEHKEQVLTSQLRLKKISPRSYKRKRGDLEEWATRERREVKEKHQSLQRKIQQDNEAKFTEQKSSLKKSLLEESNDSDQVKKAIYQANLLDKGIIGVSPDQRYIQRKKEAAESLIQEKEKVIQEQLSSKIRNLEKEKADEVLQQALEIDVEKEVERRFQAVKRQLEESQGVESARSAVSQSRDSATKQKKVVKFQDQDKASYKNQIESSNGIEESIDEAISNSYSQSFKSSSAIESKSKSLPISPPYAKPAQNPAPPAASKQQSPAKKTNIEHSESIAEMISDNYTEDFNNSEGASDSKNNLAESKSRLQNKARDLAESAAYSEDAFEEESMGQSQSAGGVVPMQVQNNNKKMDSVLEESIDESGARSKTSSRMESTNQYQQSEVPSEDQEIQGSAQSVDWQIQVPQESARTGQDLSEKSIREDSSLNSRLDPDDELMSNPDQISRSASMSASEDIFAKADFIAQNLLDQILREYKDDNSYIVSCEKKQIDEDDFKNKFPYTLDIKLVEQEIRPPSLQSQNSAKSNKSAPVKKVKSAKEIQDEIFIIKHQQEQQILKGQQQKVSDYLAFVISKVDVIELIQTLDKPIELNPLVVLAQIQAYEDEEPVRQESQPEQQQVLPQSFFVKFDKEYHSLQRLNKGARGAPTTAEKEQESLQNVHNYALFEAFNEALDQKRPYKNKGAPMPWSKNTRVVRQETTVEEANQILKSASQKVVEWSVTGAGSKYAPLPTPPTQMQDEFGEEILQPPLQEGEEDRKNQYRQEKLGQLMTQDIQETDVLWKDYEVEDTQVRFDLADMILADLASEIAAFLN